MEEPPCLVSTAFLMTSGLRCTPGGVQFIDFGSDPDFNHCVDGLVLVDLTHLKSQRYEGYIGAHLAGPG